MPKFALIHIIACMTRQDVERLIKNLVKKKMTN